MRATAAIQRVFREHHGWVLARLVRSVRDLTLAEDSLQLALEAALVQWPRDGVPDQPRAWLVRTARRRAIDELRHRTMRREKESEIEWLEALRQDEQGAPTETDLPDDMLRLLFTCCHPALAREAQVALTLRAIAGLETEEIARAFLVPVPTMAQRLVRAKKKIERAGIPYRVPGRSELDERLESVLAEWTEPEAAVYAVYPHRQHLSPKVRAFVDFLVEQFGRGADLRPSVSGSRA